MNKKSLATALVLASAVFAASATTVAPTVRQIGTIGFGADYTPYGDGNDVNWTVSAANPKGSSFTDAYDFTLLQGTGISGAVAADNSLKNWVLDSGELGLYAGIFAAGSSLSSYKPLELISFGTSGNDALVANLAAGNYFFAVQGKADGTKGGRYYFEVTAVPEPTNAALLLAGLCLVGTLVKRRRTN